jgi:hypothetical protein
LQSEAEKAIKEMMDEKAAGDDDVPGDVIKLLGEYGLKLMTQLINSIYVTGEWPRDFIEIIMIALKKPKATKCSDHHTISLITHTAKIVVRILRRRIERNTEDALGEHQFGLRREKGTRDAIGMLRIISERTLHIDKDPKGNWDRLGQKQIDQQIVHGTKCQNMIGPRGDVKSEDWKRS